MAGDEAEEKLDAKEELNADDVARELANPQQLPLEPKTSL